ncbi:hypothetical protein AYO21_06378 [Fonsecaea monophora]|uniref:Uncharacterized protein n=1 Tax=Fonsecaea monophora TaxID=254056 RepID=A0A177F7G3_9EURO|nr:hypothetical protein AYO21_06378 [Fonsecaea monophora]OAG39362.1 hypothetical protein AYO21_06378 [Fonsecaea monophora]
MSTSAYLTNARPRGRPGSFSDTSEKQTRSRASSSASAKLSKTLSRTLDEVSIPRNSRSNSPAIYFHRQRTHDSKWSDPVVVTSRHPALSLRSDKSISSRMEDDTFHSPSSPTKVKPHIINGSHDRPDTSVSDARPPSPTKSSMTAVPEAVEIMGSPTRDVELLQTSQGLRQKSFSSRSLASMQPTVSEEPQDIVPTQITSPFPPVPISAPCSTDVVEPSAKGSKSPLREETILGSPKTSKSSLHEPIATPMGTSPVPYPYDPLVAPTPQGPVVFIQPTFGQHLADSTEGDMPFMSSPPLPTDGTYLHGYPPHGRSPLASPPLSPFLQQPAGSPPPQGVPFPPPFPYHYPHPFVANPNLQLAFYPPPFPAPHGPFPYPDAVSRSGSAAPDDERTKLLEKVSSVLPDINRLLHYYQESQGLLSEKDHLVKQAESQHNEEIAKLRIELSASKEEYERIIGEQARENLKLKNEITEQGEKILHLEASSRELARANEEITNNLTLKCKTFENEVENSRSMNEQLTATKVDLEDQIEAVKKQLDDERMQHKRSQTDLIQAHEKQMADKEDIHVRLLNEHKAGLSKLQLDLAGLITKHTQQRRDLESARTVISEHEQSLAAKYKELAESTQLHKNQMEAQRKAMEETAEQHKQECADLSQKLAQAMEKHKDEITALREGHQKEIGQLRKAAEGRLSELITNHKQRESQLQDELNALQSMVEDLQDDLEEQRNVNNSLKIELATAQKAHQALQTTTEMTNQHHTELAESILCLREKQAQWQRESERMERILRSLGHTSANKGKGDNFFVSAFQSLAMSVENVAEQFFRDQPCLNQFLLRAARLSGLPDMTGTTTVARALRSLFIQNQIFTVLHQRIFRPFLFTSSNDECDESGMETCLSRVSTMICAKSVHREAIWRAITMRALYTSSYGRKAASTVATSVSKEIVDKLQSMTLAEYIPGLIKAVRSITKAAVQLWRQVRVEWAAVRSSMSPKILKTEGTSSPADITLRIRPHIYRECFRTVDDVGRDSGPPNMPPTAACIYLQGTALCQDSPLVIARRRELMADNGWQE